MTTGINNVTPRFVLQLNDLLDVKLTLPIVEDEKLTFTGGVWKNTTGGGGVTNLNDLLDVTANAPSTGDAIIFNNVSGNWESGPQAVGPVDAYVQNGNAYGVPAFIGTQDDEAITIQTNGVGRFRFENSNQITLLGQGPAPDHIITTEDGGQDASTQLIIRTGLGGAVGGSTSGQLSILSGNGPNSGPVLIASGEPSQSVSGLVIVKSGDCPNVATNGSGAMFFESGSAILTGQTTGAVRISTGIAENVSGNVTIASGNVQSLGDFVNAQVGQVLITTGIASGAFDRDGADVSITAHSGINGGAGVGGEIVMTCGNSDQLVFERDGTVRVSATNYETKVTDNNDIPNKKYVDDSSVRQNAYLTDRQSLTSTVFGANTVWVNLQTPTILSSTAEFIATGNAWEIQYVGSGGLYKVDFSIASYANQSDRITEWGLFTSVGATPLGMISVLNYNSSGISRPQGMSATSGFVTLFSNDILLIKFRLDDTTAPAPVSVIAESVGLVFTEL